MNFTIKLSRNRLLWVKFSFFLSNLSNEGEVLNQSNGTN